jgi:ParB-like chromosome segregation protein Spo0J
LLPPLAPEVLAQLEASIRERGVEDPVAVDEAGQTLDGHHRRMIAERLGVRYETRVVAGLTEDEKRLYAIRRNTERRQLSKAQRALIGMRAEPSFRAEAKARQGTRTDLWPNRAESRRLWAAEEAARLVGLPVSTYKDYRRVITEARRERGADAVDRLIDMGTWDVAEVRTAVEESARRARAAREQAEAEERRRQAVAAAEENARQAWATHGLLGRGADGPRTSDDWWQCPTCEAYYPPSIAACERCGKTSRDAADEAAAVTVEAIGGEPLPVVAPRLSWRESRPQPKELDDHRYTHLKTEDGNRLWPLQQSQLQWYAHTDPTALVRQAVADWSPRRVADLQDGIRLLTGWLTALDDALSDARLLPSTPAEDTANGDGDAHE